MSISLLQRKHYGRLDSGHVQRLGQDLYLCRQPAEVSKRGSGFVETLSKTNSIANAHRKIITRG
ncbi:MAG: hypothetical protein ACN4GR_14330 [Arenicellales bacterium]